LETEAEEEDEEDEDEDEEASSRSREQQRAKRAGDSGTPATLGKGPEAALGTDSAADSEARKATLCAASGGESRAACTLDQLKIPLPLAPRPRASAAARPPVESGPPSDTTSTALESSSASSSLLI